MLSYHADTVNKKVKSIVGMTFLDQRIRQVVAETAINLYEPNRRSNGGAVR